MQGLNDPMCEIFPKIAACRYHRYGMGGQEDDRHAICILGLNMINDKVFIATWIWHYFIIVIGSIRILTRSLQMVSKQIRYLLVRLRMNQYLKNNAHVKHIQHYILNCSIGKKMVGNICLTQCGNFRNFLPHRFHVKSIFGIPKGPNCHFDTFEALNLDFWRFFAFIEG